MENPTLDLIMVHRSIRRYRAETVPDDTVRALVAAAQRSSTSSNLQMFSVVAVRHRATLARLAELCGNQAHIAEAPLFLAWCADLNRLGRVCELRGYVQVTEYLENFLVAAMDATIASQTAALAAESLGLGICYIGAIRNDPPAVVELLGLPPLVFPVAGMTLGWPAADPALKPRLATDAVLHWEHYDRTGQDAHLAAYDRVMIDSGIYEGRRVPVPGQPGEVEEYGWIEHSARRASQPARTGLRRAVEQQGFALK